MFRSVLTPDGNIQFVNNYLPVQTIIPSFATTLSPAEVLISPMVTPSIVDFTDEEKRAIRENEFKWATTVLPSYWSNSRYTHNDVNNDPNLRRETVKYFYDKFKHTWLPEYFNNLYKYFKVVNGEVKYIDSLSDIDTSTDNYEIKARFIVSHIFEKIDMEALIEKYALKNRVNWYDLKKYKSDIRDYVHHKIDKHIRNRVNKL